MRVEKRKVSELKEYPGNPRWITPTQMNHLRESIQEFGLVVPLVINTKNEVIGGNQRLKVLKELGVEEVECIVVDLPKAEEKKLNLALNRIHGEWKVDALLNFVADLEIQDLAMAGFEKVELEVFRKMREDFEDFEKLSYDFKLITVIVAYTKNEEEFEELVDFLDREGIEWK